MRIAHSSPTGFVGPRLLVIVATVLLVGACSSGGPVATAGAPATGGLPAISVGPDATAAPAGAGGTTAAIDPCQRLTKADVQPFFSVPVVTQLPSPVPGTCEWSSNDTPGGVSTSMDVGVMTGQDALDSWSMADGPGPKTTFSGVGDQAEHYPGSTDFVSIKGDVLCKITTFGTAHLAGRMNYTDPMAIPDAAATQIAQSYGTLCNKIYGSGTTTPAITAPPVSAGAIASAIPTPKASIPALGGTLGKAFPLPAGLDCTGHTTTDTEGALICDAKMTGDQFAVYPFDLATLPADGYQINHQQEETAGDGKEVASILFQGNEAGGLSTISIIGTDVTITLQAP